VILNPGDIVLDYATWRPTLDDFDRIAQQQGRPVRAVVRYQAAKTSIPAKLLQEPERRWLHEVAQVGIIVCHESYATRAASGFNGGVADGQYIQAWADSVGYPADVPIAAADDTNETAPTVPTAYQYQLGFDVVNSRPTGPYGDNDIMQACVDRGAATGVLWYAGARSWSGGHDPIAECHVQQTVAGSVAGKYDMNHVLLPLRAWGGIDRPEDTDMKICANAEARTMPYGEAPPASAIFAIGDFKRNIGAEEYRLLYGNVAPILLSNAALDAVPDYSPGATDQIARDKADHANAGVDMLDKRLDAASQALA
jgi:hypothetical protein